MARKPPALARELLRNFPKRRARNARRRRKGPARATPRANGAAPEPQLESTVAQELQREGALDHAGGKP
jgi:hypothetical protein